MIFEAPNDVLSSDGETEVILPSELESLILSYIKGRKIPKKMKLLLSAPVIAGGQSYNSPEEIWKTTPRFREWCTERLQWLSEQPDKTVQRAVYLIRDYTTSNYGWIRSIARMVEKENYAKKHLASHIEAAKPKVTDVDFGD